MNNIENVGPNRNEKHHHHYKFASLSIQFVRYTALQISIVLSGSDEKVSRLVNESSAVTPVFIFAFQNCPILFAVILDYLSQLTYYDRPDYVGLERAFVDCLKVRGIRWNQPMDWELDVS